MKGNQETDQDETTRADADGVAGAIEAAPTSMRVMVTGGSGFVGGYVVKELLRQGHRPVCLARDPQRLLGRLGASAGSRLETVKGSLSNGVAVRRAMEGAGAVIHLVGIILESPLQSFRRVHVNGTRAVIRAAREAGVQRMIHMSALGARPNAIAKYHRTKYEAEELLKSSGLDWTVFRPSIIHAADGEFMQLMKAFVRPKLHHGPILAMPYFGTGEGKLQPVSVLDVAYCMVAAIGMEATIGQTYSMGGPEVVTWKQLYTVCARAIAGKAKRQISVPIPLAKLLAVTIMKTPLVPKLLRFNRGQVQMSQEDSVCDTAPVEDTFGITLRSFEDRVKQYADLIP